jgi:TolB-like protein
MQISQSPVAPRLSIVVLPFANLSDDREQQYFADGITDDLTTDPSRISGSFVIARNTAFRLAASSVFDMCSKVACGGLATKSVRTFS